MILFYDFHSQQIMGEEISSLMQAKSLNSFHGRKVKLFAQRVLHIKTWETNNIHSKLC